MTREEINEWAKRNNNALHCLRVMVEEEVYEECELYGTTGTDHCEADCVREEAIAYANRVIELGLNDETQAFCETAIKALEQERYYKNLANSYEKTINKLTKAISEKEPILDKIRAEIHKAWCTHPQSRYEEGLKDQALRDVKIIDRYRAESEVKE